MVRHILPLLLLTKDKSSITHKLVYVRISINMTSEGTTDTRALRTEYALSNYNYFVGNAEVSRL